MLALAGLPFDCRFVFFDPSSDCCAATFGHHIRASYDDREQLLQFAKSVDVVTYEFESVPIAAVNYIAEHSRVYPPPNALAVTQDRLTEKRLFRRLGIPTTEFFDIVTRADLLGAARALNYPFVLKSRFGGYDGKGQAVISASRQLDEIWPNIASRPTIAEKWVHFDREVSMVAVRSAEGDMKFYDLVENRHRNGVLQLSLNRPGDPSFDQACEYTQALMNTLDYCGVLALEFFQTGAELVANEYAPRVHNSGHWTIEGAVTSQFENHLRAILNLSLGTTSRRGYSAMINFVGRLPDLEEMMALPNSHYHQYGKLPKPGRKVAHLTLCSDQSDTVEPMAKSLITTLIEP
jgi:5-(carboxyamino)imidazole ribonucleotide synthase